MVSERSSYRCQGRRGSDDAQFFRNCRQQKAHAERAKGRTPSRTACGYVSKCGVALQAGRKDRFAVGKDRGERPQPHQCDDDVRPGVKAAGNDRNSHHTRWQESDRPRYGDRSLRSGRLEIQGRHGFQARRRGKLARYHAVYQQAHDRIAGPRLGLG